MKLLAIGITLLALTLEAVSQCPQPVHETCQMPSFNPQHYDPNNSHPYNAPDMREYNRCMANNRREDARYQRCLKEERREQELQRYCRQNPNAKGCN
jgi:hypothetical protein